MSYVPRNVSVYSAAFAGALAAISMGGRSPSETSALGTGPSLADTGTATYAQEFDFQWNGAYADGLQIELIKSMSLSLWLDRAPQSLVPTDYTQQCTSIIAYIQAAENFYTANGITPPATPNSGGGLVPPSNGSWKQSLWVIDPQNPLASDTNPGTFALPVKTYGRGVVARWGTIAPLLTQDTRIVFASSQTDDTDPVLFNPISSAGTASIEGTPTTVTAGIVLSGVVPKSTVAGANSLLMADLGATAAVDQLVVNRTRGSVARVYKLSGGTVWELSQPYAAAVIGQTPGAQDNTWANGDIVDLLKLTDINLAQCEPTINLANAIAGNSYVYLYRVRLFVPPSGPIAVARLGAVRFYEGGNARKVFISGESNAVSPASTTSSCFFNVSNASSLNGVCGLAFIGGYHRLGANQISAVYLDSYILGSALTVYSGAQSFLTGEIYIDNSNALILTNSAVLCFAGLKIYGRASRTITLQGMSRLAIDPGDTFTGVFTAPFIISNGVKMNGVQTASSVVSGSPSVINGGITTTPANLDAAAGAAGFGGLAFNLGGSCLAKTP